MIGVIVPAHNEQTLLGRCLESLARAARAPALRGETVRVIVVLDACSDRSAEIAAGHQADTVVIDACNVGQARARGADYALDTGARWLAFTDADSMVAPDWLVAQQAHTADAVCGTVVIDRRAGLPILARLRHEQRYRDMNGHRHVHGANLGVSAAAYRRAGGVPGIAAHEDVVLVRRLEAVGARIAWSAAPRVVTSPRTDHRAPDGFGRAMHGLLGTLRRDIVPVAPPPER